MSIITSPSHGMRTISASELIALLHLASPALPVGGFSYSQGLEAAIDAGLVSCADSAHHWISDGLQTVLARCELPFIAQQMRRWHAYQTLHRAGSSSSAAEAAINATDTIEPTEATSPTQVAEAIEQANDWYLASRESAELRQETEQMGWSLVSLSASLSWGDAASRTLLTALSPIALPTAFAFVTATQNIAAEASLAAYAFNWVENQVAAALKAVPLGQIAGQRILFALHDEIARASAQALTLAPDQLSTFSPLLGILSSRHEMQYSRLFRS